MRTPGRNAEQGKNLASVDGHLLACSRATLRAGRRRLQDRQLSEERVRDRNVRCVAMSIDPAGRYDGVRPYVPSGRSTATVCVEASRVGQMIVKTACFRRTTCPDESAASIGQHVIPGLGGRNGTASVARTRSLPVQLQRPSPDETHEQTNPPQHDVRIAPGRMRRAAGGNRASSRQRRGRATAPTTPGRRPCSLESRAALTLHRSSVTRRPSTTSQTGQPDDRDGRLPRGRLAA